jgi:hypothetical protein
MLVLLNLDRARLWRWHLTLIAQLSADPAVRVDVEFDVAWTPLPTALILALQLEEALGRRTPHPCDRITPADFEPWLRHSGKPDLTIDLACNAEPTLTGRYLTPLFDGMSGEGGFWEALLDGRAPALGLFDTRSAEYAIGQPALETPHAVRISAASVISRLITGLLRAVRVAPDPCVCHPAPRGATPLLVRPAAHLIARKVAIKAQRIIERRTSSAPQWAVVLRSQATEPDVARPVPATQQLDLGGFDIVADDRRRYYADPFFFAHAKGVDLFVEELPYATGRGIISVCTVSPDGTTSRPRPVLETAHHLSYPHVFERDGAIFMLPEASASGRLTLYRAARYPDQWEPITDLIDEPVHDATLFEHEGRLWITAATQGSSDTRWGSSWDSLSLYSAPHLLGPWVPHRGNPVLIDARSARPAGEIFRHGAGVFRPVQDCSDGYGFALAIAQITRLDDACFTQRLVSRITIAPRPAAEAAPSAASPVGKSSSFMADAKSMLDTNGQSILTGLSDALSNVNPYALPAIVGPHTFNRITAGERSYEAIDVFASPRQLAERDNDA